MADQKISQLTGGGAAQATDEYVVARAGGNNKITGANVAAAATSVGTLTSLTVSGDLTVDTNTLYVKSSANEVGIGTTSTVSGTPLTVQAGSGYTDVLWLKSAGTNIDSRINFGPTGTGKAQLNNTTGTGIDFQISGSTKASFDSSGNLAVDTNTLYVDAANNRVGVGTASPSYVLDVAGRTRLSGTGYSSASSPTLLIDNTTATTGRRYAINSANGGLFQIADDTAGGVSLVLLDASGNLGLGVTPSYKLDITESVNSTTNDTIHIANSSTASNGVTTGILFSAGGASSVRPRAAIRAADDGAGTGRLMFYFREPAVGAISECGRFTGGGYFKASNDGMYVNTAGTYHELRNTANSIGLYITNTSASLTNECLYIAADRNTTNNTFFPIVYYNNGAAATKFRVADSGDVTNTNGTYGTISDIKHKQDVIDAPSQWDDLKAVRFRKFRMKSDVEANPDAPYLLGVIAQELEQTSPGLVDEHPDFEEQEVTDEDGNVTTERVQVGTTKTVKSSILLMKAAVALQEAMARIEALEARLEALEA